MCRVPAKSVHILVVSDELLRGRKGEGSAVEWGGCAAAAAAAAAATACPLGVQGLQEAVKQLVREQGLAGLGRKAPHAAPARVARKWA